MMWDELTRDFLIPMAEDDAALIAALGGLLIFEASSSRPAQIPSVEWLVTDDVLTEVFNPIEIQFDFWTPNMGKAVTIEKRLRALYHRNVRVQIAGYDMAMQYTDRFAHDSTQPGVIHRSLRFQFEPVRHRYAQRVTS